MRNNFTIKINEPPQVENACRMRYTRAVARSEEAN